MQGKINRLEELDAALSSQSLWDNPDKAQEISKEHAFCSSQVKKISKLMTGIDSCEGLLEIFTSESDPELQQECILELEELERNLGDFELQKMLKGEHDVRDVIIEINAGAGGTEAQDWADMLLRMYLRYGEKAGFGSEIAQILPADEAGIKSATVIFRGENAYGFLRSERGVHRLVRISPFDSNARRHTSFASVSVMPDIELDIQIDINDDDLRIDTFRAGGAGGQHINKTDSAVRITHLPTNIVVACQNERSQHKNKATCMKLLKAKLYERELEKQEKDRDAIAGERKKIEWGSQIRSYVMQPYQMVKDLRTGYETSQVQSVLDGDLEEFLRSFLLSEYNVG